MSAGLAPDDPLGPLAALPEVAQAVAASRLAVDRFGRHRVLRRQGTRVRTESLLRGAAAAAGLELGRVIGTDELQHAADDAADADPVLRGALRAYAEIGDLVGVWRQAPRQALARLHTVAARDVVGDDDLGRPRTSGTGAGQPAAERLGQLSDVVGRTRAPGLVVAAVVHAELATVRPFGSLDTVVALAAARLVLVERGVDPGAYAVVEVAHRDAGAAYLAALDAFARGEPGAVGAWVVRLGAAVEDGVREATAIAEAIARG